MLKLPDLPYGYDALAPVLSDDTLHAHHDKHHAAYVEKTNALAKKAGLETYKLEDLIREARQRGDQALFNNAAQAWNHGFFWECMTPDKASPDGALKKAIDDAFGGLDALKDKFVEEGVGHFASGWVWLTAGERGLEVISTHDADDTFTKAAEFPLLTCDLWEHAYYLDYKQDRPTFLKRWFDDLANWKFAERQFAAARNPDAGYHYPLAA
jgi:superoxide dismutase, Fe-Mn family